MAKDPQPGDIAPDFELVGTHGRFQLSEHRGERVVLLFYPGDNMICTRQFCSYRDRVDQFSELGVRAVGISLDVTERRTLELQYHQSQKVEAIGRLTGGVAHDFNNILTIILSHTFFLLEDLSPADPRRTDALEIKAAAERAAGLTRQLLAFSRKQVLAPRALDLNVLITGMEKMLRRLIGRSSSMW